MQNPYEIDYKLQIEEISMINNTVRTKRSNDISCNKTKKCYKVSKQKIDIEDLNIKDLNISKKRKIDD